ncbi:hypothetical protein KJ785_03530 [Patescibacteria group bacterium]|nr:hypothetical protein [Patescibacteria group bacterium]
MSNQEIPRNESVYKGTQYYIKKMEESGLIDRLPFFNDVLTGREAVDPDSWDGTILRDVVIDGKTCDVYHTDKFIRNKRTDKQKTEGSGCRVYIHIKD